MRPNSCSIQAPTWRVDRGKLAATQAFKLSSCAALIKPALPPISKLVRPSIPPCSKSLRQPRIVSSSSNNALATSRQLHPSSKSTRAFARRVIRLAAAPSRANAISLLRSSSPRKPPRIMPLSESDQQRNARNFPEPSMSRGIFGLTVEQIIQLRAGGYHPRQHYEMNPVLRETIDQIASGVFSPGNRDLFRPIVDSLLDQDTYLVLADFHAYLECQHKADKAFRDQERWTRM